jgi:16S rRNA (cytidine1402-2'-O)-methyltransferase
VVSGLPTDRFLVAGFLPPKAGARKRAIQELASVPASLIWFEAPQRLEASLLDLADELGPRPAAVARELTKRFEEVRRGTLDHLARLYQDLPQPRGEIVIVVGPPIAGRTALSDDDVEQALSEAMATMSPSAAAAAVAAATGRPKRELYKKAIGLRSPGP